MLERLVFAPSNVIHRKRDTGDASRIAFDMFVILHCSIVSAKRLKSYLQH